MFRWIVGVVALLAVGCADTSDLEQRVAALESTGSAEIVGRHVERRFDGAWVPWSRPLVIANPAAEGVAVAGSLEPFEVWGAARLQVTIRDPGLSMTYSLSLTIECFDLVRVGDPWPSEHEECR